jgi:hypothetical protein
MHWVEGSLNLSLFFLFYVCCFLCLLIARAEALVLEGSMFVFFGAGLLCCEVLELLRCCSYFNVTVVVADVHCGTYF